MDEEGHDVHPGTVATVLLLLLTIVGHLMSSSLPTNLNLKSSRGVSFSKSCWFPAPRGGDAGRADGVGPISRVVSGPDSPLGAPNRLSVPP